MSEGGHGDAVPLQTLEIAVLFVEVPKLGILGNVPRCGQEFLPAKEDTLEIIALPNPDRIASWNGRARDT